MQQLEEQIKDLRGKLDKAKDELYRAELRLETLEREETALLQECQNLGISPDNLQEQIEKLESQIKADLENANALLEGNK